MGPGHTTPTKLIRPLNSLSSLDLASSVEVQIANLLCENLILRCRETAQGRDYCL